MPGFLFLGRIKAPAMPLKKEDLRIVFMGTPDFAVPSLEAIIHEGYTVAGVITAPDSPSGRGRKLKYSPVKDCAIKHNLTVLQPEKLKRPEFLKQLGSLKADLQIVVAFRMLPQEVWDMPRLGSINLHGSLLPQYRGAAPLNHAIINGEKSTGLTTFFLDKEIDTGRILLRKEIPIYEEDTFGSLHDRMMVEGASLLIETIERLRTEQLASVVQDTLIDSTTQLKRAPKIFKGDCAIDWQQSVADIYNFVRGLDPFPGAFTHLLSPEGIAYYIKVYRTKKEIVAHRNALGSLETDKRSYLKVAVKDGYVYLTEVQLAGKKRIEVASFLKGFALNNDWKLT